MPVYSLKAPNGKTYQISGPAGATQAAIQAEVLRQNPEAAGGTAAPAAAPKPAAGNQYLDKYNSIRSNLAAGEQDPQRRQIALTRFDSDPRAQRLRQLAGLAPLSTRQGDVQQVAKQSIQQRVTNAGADIGKDATGTQSASAGIARGMFGLPEIIAAAGERFLPSAVTGNNTNASFGNILQMIRSKDTAAINAHPGAGIGGEIGGSIVGGGAAGKVVMKGAGKLASASSPIVSKIGQLVENLGTLRKGQKLANAAKISATGAAAGATQATGEGGNPIVGAAEGAVAAPVIAGGLKVAQVISRPFRDVLRLSSAGQILSRLTTVTKDELMARAAAYRNATGAEPTVFELLPLADRNKILGQAVVGKDNVVEQASNAIRTRAANLGPEMSAKAKAVLAPSRTFIENGIRKDLATARGGKLLPEDDNLIQSAMDSPTDMSKLRDAEADAIMAPHRTTPVVAKVTDLLPTVPGPNGGQIDVDPALSATIRSAAGILKLQSPNQGITAGDITDMISTLRSDIGKGGAEGRYAQAASDHLQDVLNTNAPAAGKAAQQMSDAYAARSRMIEGMKEGAATRLRDDVQVGTNRGQARTVRNAYDTPEGNNGLSLGQGNRVVSNLGGSPEEALRATIGMSRGSTGRPLANNIGTSEASELFDAARAQDNSAQALSSASNKAQSGSGDGANAETLVQAIAGLHPSSFITTKAGAIRKLLDMTYIPETRAKTMVDMLFSQDPKLTQKAMNAIGNEPNGAAFIKYLSGASGQVAADADVSSKESTPTEPTVPVPASTAEVPTDASPEEPAAPAEAPAADTPPAAAPDPNAGGSPYSPVLANIYQQENPEVVSLVQRVKHQESGGNQAAVSKKGAVGVMQVMPDTGPEAAKLAGVPWDPKAYKSDATYNEILGHAYLAQMLRKYNGDVGQALAAYNGGTGTVDSALTSHGDNWLGAMPAETQDYVARVGS